MSDWWTELSQEFVPYLNVTAHLDDKPDQDLLTAKGGSGFPTSFFFDPETGAVLNDWFAPSSADAVREVMKKAKAKSDELTSLRKDAEARPDDKPLQAELKIRLAMMRAGDTSIEELAELAKTPGLDEGLLKEFEGWFGAMRVEKLLGKAQMAETREEFEEQIREGFHKLLKEGVRLDYEHQNAQFYYAYAFHGSVDAEDHATAQKAFDGYKAVMKLLVAQRPQYKAKVEEDLQSYQEALDELAASKR